MLCRLHEIGKEDNTSLQGGQSSDTNSRKVKCSHCSFCGHPGSKRDHVKFPCEYCDVSHGSCCIKKPDGFKCNCSSCDTVPHRHVSMIDFTLHCGLDESYFFSLCANNYRYDVKCEIPYWLEKGTRHSL